MGADAPRGGTRGGRDQFNWEAVKTDKDRDLFLGAAVMAPVGRWQKNKDILWYTREGGGADATTAAAAAARDELARVKEEEDQAMREALGLAPRVEKRAVTAMDAADMAHLLQRGGVDGPAEAGADAGAGIPGLGFAHKTSMRPQAGEDHDILQGMGVDGPTGVIPMGRPPPGLPPTVSARVMPHGTVPTAGEAKAAKRAAKEAKRARKDVKRARKEAKRARKEAKRVPHEHQEHGRPRPRAGSRSRSRSRDHHGRDERSRPSRRHNSPSSSSATSDSE